VRSADGERAARRDSRWPVSQIVGLTLLAVSALTASIVASASAPYAIERPGPVYDVLGDTTVDDAEVPMIEIVDAETYATDGVLNMLTINATGPTTPPTWLEVVEATFDPSRAVLPIELLYPPSDGSVSTGDQQAIQMENSKRSAIAAALDHLGYELIPEMRVAEVVDDSPALGILQIDDIIVSANGQALQDVDELRTIVGENGVDRPVEIVVDRAGQQLTLEVTPTLDDEEPPSARLGILVAGDWGRWPIDIRIQLENVGGPSAGMMFALGIIDKLTPDSLTGGEVIAGTGTITAVGEVGPIGGIRQKLFGAVRAGATWFLAPSQNCDEVVGHVPDGIQVFAVSTLDEAVATLDVIAAHGDTSTLTTCEAVVGD
jgi:PDZ domain-containing protein